MIPTEDEGIIIMRYYLTHETTYTYSKPIFLEPHTIRLHPRAGNGIQVRNFKLDVIPIPAGQSENLDLYGNTVNHLWFDGMMQELKLTTSFEVESMSWNPYYFIVNPPEAGILPVSYSVEELPQIHPYLIRCSTNVPVTAFATATAQEVDRQTLPFLSKLNDRISGMCERIIRPEGAPYQPTATLQQLKGSCRDLAVLFIDACRAVGLAARFVSGYVLNEADAGERDLHAWAEVYLPGAGWRGFDPSQGVAIASQHVPVAAGRISSEAAPVSGAIRGNNVKRDFKAQIVLSELVQAAL